MFTHDLVEKTWISHEIEKDGTFKTILHVKPKNPASPGSDPETKLTNAIVEYLKANDHIDRADVGA
ncbi:hypothetical protein [Aquidulcibacter sp.]|jgi:hypothetical protein|uniref:hypothetical protein n=1 Tax=Aquidulcibacter sp. TaxID=2052990 RepID=UPI003BA6EE4C